MDRFVYTTERMLSGERVDLVFGVRLVGNIFTIFLIQSESSKYFAEEMPTVCMEILAEYRPGRALQDFGWRYIAGPAQSDLIFEHRNCLAVRVIVTNGAVFEPYCTARSVGEYQSALDDPRGLNESLLDGYPEEVWASFSAKPVVRYLVHTPKHPRFPIHMLENPYANVSGGKYPVVLVDPRKFLLHWKKQCSARRGQNRFVGYLHRLLSVQQTNELDNIDIDDQQLLGSSLETSLKYVIPSEMACGVKLNHNAKIRFCNGRHRTVNLLNLGAYFIPVQVDSHQVDIFRDHFEWTGAKALAGHGWC